MSNKRRIVLLFGIFVFVVVGICMAISGSRNTEKQNVAVVEYTDELQVTELIEETSSEVGEESEASEEIGPDELTVMELPDIDLDEIQTEYVLPAEGNFEFDEDTYNALDIDRGLRLFLNYLNDKGISGYVSRYSYEHSESGLYASPLVIEYIGRADWYYECCTSEGLIYEAVINSETGDLLTVLWEEEE